MGEVVNIRGEVVNIGDIRGKHLVKEMLKKPIEKEQTLPIKERVFLRNLPFFLHRMTTAGYGPCSFSVGKVNGFPVLYFRCEPHDCVYGLDEDSIIVYEDAVVTRWDSAEGCEFPQASLEALGYEEE